MKRQKAAWQRVTNSGVSVGSDRYIVSPEQEWRRLRSDDRLMLNGIYWILCSGTNGVTCQCAMVPENMLYQRFRHRLLT